MSASERPAPTGYGRGARLLSIGLASTGLVTFAYFSVASYVLDDVDYKRISLLWSVLFVTVTVIYRPVEQLLSRNLAAGRDVVGTALRIQAAFACVALLIAVVFRDRITDGVLGGEDALWCVLVAAVRSTRRATSPVGGSPATSASSSTAGWCSSRRSSRLLFAIAVAVGLATGQVAVALGMAAAPLVSLVVVPLAFRRADTAASGERLEGGGRFAVAVLVIMLAEQTLINAAVLTADATATDAAVAGFVFNALLIARAPLQLFQAIQGSLLPHLAGLEPGDPEFGRAVRITVLAIAAFAGAVAVGLLVLGPWAMDLLFDDPFRLPARRAGAGGGRHGRAPRRRDAQPGRPGPRPRRGGRRLLGRRRGGLRRLDALERDRRRAAARRGGLRGRRGGARAAAVWGPSPIGRIAERCRWVWPCP